MKRKLELKKKVISSLTDTEKKNVIGGGDDAYTTSFSDCTYFICCGPGCPDPTIPAATCPETQTCATECPDNTCTCTEYPQCPMTLQDCYTLPEYTCM